MPARNRLNSLLATSAAILLVGLGLVIAIAQEKPIGSLIGTVIAEDTGNRIAARVQLISQDKKYYRSVDAGKDGGFRFANVPAGEYTIQCSGEWHRLKPIRVRVEEGKTKEIDIEAPPNDPELDLYVEEHVFTPEERPRVTGHGWTKAESFTVRIYDVNLPAFLTKADSSMQELLQYDSFYGSGGQNKVRLDTNPALKLVKSYSTPIKGRDIEGVFTQRLDLPSLPSGLYLVSINTGGLQGFDWIVVTSLGMVTKTAGNQTLAYTTDLKTGKPTPGTKVSVYVDRKLVASGKTDAQGLLNLRLPADIKGAVSQTIMAQNGLSSAFANAEYSSTEDSRRTIYAYTERPVYKPGQRVYFRGVVRDAVNSGYKALPNLPMLVEARDGRDTLIYRGMLKTDRFGSYHGSFVLNKETSSGSYTLVSTPEGQGRGTSIDFQVAAYRKPEFEVKVNFPKKHYPVGSEIRASVSADYYFGAPVADSTISYVIHKQPYWSFGDDEEDIEGYEDYGGYGEEVSSGTVQTDGQGRAVISFIPKQEEAKDDYDLSRDETYTIDASITDKSENEATGTASTLVTQGDFSLDISQDQYIVDPGQKVEFYVIAKDYDKHMVASQKVTITTGMQTYGDDGVSKFRKTGEYQVVTDKSGRAFLQFPATEPGNIKIMANSSDSHGRAIKTISYVWCFGESFGDTGNPSADLEVVTDKKIYKPGETAKVLINTRKVGTTALVTIEGSRIYDSKTVKITSSSTMIRIPMKSEYKPNCYIGVCFVKNKKLSSRQELVRVSIDQSALKIAVHPNRSKYLPGEKATYDLRATDVKGRPVRAQLSIGVVDEAIYAIQKDTTTNILDYFYARKPNKVQTSFSFPEIYLSDPDKAGPAVSEVAAKRAMRSAGKNAKIRRIFKDTAFWNPTVETDANGHASVSFLLPDNLTTWRATVRGETEGSLFGEATNSVITQQDFMVRLETPRFLVQSDKATISAIVHNYTGSGVQTRVSLDCPGMSITDGPDRDVFVGNEKDERVTWLVNAGAPGWKSITLRAKSSDRADGMQIGIPVYPLGVRRTGSDVGELSTPTGSKKTPVEIRSDGIPGTAVLKVRYAPSLAGSLLGSVRYLAEYPWGCTEQTVSSFLPDVILTRSLSELGVHDPKTEAELPNMVTTGLLRLYRFQLPDDGWSWCEYGEADEWMTGYVCYALIRARQAGYQVNKDVLDRGLARLSEMMNSQPKYLGMKKRAYSLYFLSLAGRDVSGKLLELTGKEKLSNQALALITLGYFNLNKRAEAEASLQLLFSRSNSDSAAIYWSEQNGYLPDSVETTAFALEALLRLHPNDDRAFRIVRWLMQHRESDYWFSTRQTAMVLYSMSLFLKGHKELTPDYKVTILLNGKVEAKKHIGRDAIFEPEGEIQISAPDLRKGTNTLEIRKSGQGTLYYSTELTQFVTNGLDRETVGGGGLSISREYYKSDDDDDDARTTTKHRLSEASVGDTILVRLTLNSKVSLDHLLVEDFVPAGCEIQNKGNVDYWDWRDWWVGSDVRDEKISFYIDSLSPGKHVIQYRMRAGFSGKYHALPAEIFAMYEPDQRAATAASEFTIR